ncbi:hypothetical protein SAMN05892877_108112 [Rhizobium subbaraonis]|uniref:Uncharacterized protein n=1 Tax=Rhizobium subbaraonis TaxID=908946 RepID=A0A285UI74_9HYPH|nr:hypothetical protein SAMN05892877_108112 [Rhizobium subbaraonis]
MVNELLKDVVNEVLCDAHYDTLPAFMLNLELQMLTPDQNSPSGVSRIALTIKPSRPAVSVERGEGSLHQGRCRIGDKGCNADRDAIGHLLMRQQVTGNRQA